MIVRIAGNNIIFTYSTHHHDIHHTTHLYTESKEDVFHAFEDVAIPIIAKYNGKMLLRLRPGHESVLYSAADAPYEVHLISFETAEDFEAFKKDEERKQFLHLKEASIRSSLLIQGIAI